MGGLGPKSPLKLAEGLESSRSKAGGSFAADLTAEGCGVTLRDVMKKISVDTSGSPNVFYFAAQGVLVYAAVFAFARWSGKGGAVDMTATAVVVIVMSFVGYYYQRGFTGRLVDEVYDCGEYLLVRKGGAEQKVPLSSIINVNYAATRRAAMVSLLLEQPGPFGREIEFVPPTPAFTMVNAPNATAQDLTQRAVRARAQRQSPPS